MKVCLYHKFILVIINLFIIAAIESNAQVNLTIVYPHIGPNNMEVKWNPVVGAEEYEYRKKVNSGAYSAWTSVALNTTFMDNGLSATDLYTYQIRVKLAGVWSAPSNERKNRFTLTWPVRKAGDRVTETVELLHGFGQPIVAGGNKYFHEGIDIHGESAVDNEVVRAPAGGIILNNGGAGSNIYVAIQFSFSGITKYMLFNHLKSNNANLLVGESVTEGDSLGLIANGIWNTLTSHTHVQSYTNAVDFITTAQNPFKFWTSNAHRDPQQINPEIFDTNGDGESIRFRKTPASTDYFPADGKVHNGVDIVAEAIDKQSSDAPYQVPKMVGYYIQQQENGAWKDAVKTSAAPYILVDNNIYYESHSTSPNTPVVSAIIDYRDVLKSKAPTTPAAYQFEQWFTYILTNTKGTDGTKANLDTDQQWSTDARKTVAEANGYKTNYDKARAIDEAKFTDGKYKVFVRLTDWVNTPADTEKEIAVDNFRPYAKKVTIKSGKLDYSATWNWQDGAGQLVIDENKDTTKACGKIMIKITTSEPMKNVDLDIPTLSFTKSNNTPVAGTNAKEWEFEIPEATTKDKPEGPHKLLIAGKDLADNDLQGFTSKANIPGATLQKKKLDGTWVPATAPVKDNIHEFKLFSLKDKITVATTDATSCNKNDGKATVTVSKPGNFEYAVDGGGFQASNKFEDLAKGKHEARVREKNGECEEKKEFTINVGTPLSVSVSGFGTTEFCNNANPPTVTLTATASGGSGKYEYSWPGGSITVSGSGSYSVTVTDTVTKCTESQGGQVVFVPIVCSKDPNDIIGPVGYGPGKMISKFKQHPYLIRFENDPDFATAPAQIVKITHPLDTNVNIFSLRLGDFGFGGLIFTMPENRTYYSTRIDVMDSLGVVVDLTAGIDVSKKEAFWIFESKDPNTGLPPEDATLGFLPVNDSSAKGEGFVSYTIKPANHTETGDTIFADASIIFDNNAPIETPQIFNLIDGAAPVSSIVASPVINDSVISLTWSGYDEINGSGLRDYTIYVSENNGPFVIYLTGLTDTAATFIRRGPNAYSFFTIATDNVGNAEAMKDSGDIDLEFPGKECFRSIVSGNWNNPATWQSSLDSITWTGSINIPSITARSIVIQHGHNIIVAENTVIDKTVVQSGGSLSVTAGSVLTVNNGGLTLQSEADSSARIAKSNGTIIGNVTVERFIPARRAWGLLSVPLNNTQTIYQAWQENGNNRAGFGTHITGGNATNGFDQSIGNASSILRFNPSANAFVPLSSTLLSLTSEPGYLLYVRGDRTIDLSQENAPPVNTILRANGSLNMGTLPAVNVAATGFTLVANPYASPLDFLKIDKTNVPYRFYVWDPKRSSAGAFVLFDSADNYAPLAVGGSYTGSTSIIQSGQAFFVEGGGTAGTLGISENSKSDLQRNVFRTNDGIDEKLQVNLHFYNTDSSTTLADAALTRYNNLYSNAVIAEDAGKPDNIDENLAIDRNSKRLMLERRPLIDSSDTTFLRIYNMKQKDYQFEIIPTHFTAQALSAYLEDDWLKTVTPVSLLTSSVIRFAVTGDTASANPNRFRIVFKMSGPLPVNFTAVNAYQKNAGIQVDWRVETESNIKHYEVEKSATGEQFTKAGIVLAKANNNTAVSYNWFDANPFTGNNFYRIRALDKAGLNKYSQVVNVRTGNGKSSIVFYPNPVKDRTVFVQLNNQLKGTYLIQLFNSAGQQVFTKTIEHIGGSITQTLRLKSIVSKGVYHFQVTNGKSKTTKQIIFY